MVEMTTGQRSFNDCKFDFDLVVRICNGLRPNFAPGTPDCYVELANHCMNSDPEKRPSIIEIITKLDEWLKISKSKQFLERIIKNKSKDRITKKQFLASDEINKNSSIISEHLNNIYTSKPYNIFEICSKLSKLGIIKSASIIEIPDDI
ncbi:hypothetical protein C2G38_2011076 [Gigaspora rosea]|uniref:Serine-threonine/tyrosine-protein kinase catalytic domain-containing protein n=1 Tax=Gigaspora rosea TaxID=44941 RepID=A0A397WAR2_9GLOM|nr:hypothetical protein C2G38_2011076 [Gigaspora rosea]